MAEFKAIVSSPNHFYLEKPCYKTPEGLYFYIGIEYKCYIKQEVLPFGQSPSDDIPTFVEIVNDTAKIGMLLDDFLKHFKLMAKCEHCGKWFETIYPSQFCYSCNAFLSKSMSNMLDHQFSNPNIYKRFKDRFKED